ncbi:hypothetical protein KR093_010486 [Drosophila rubida]|uniref:Uncharacterized protein n=1 Tax=Drosophila rubida TaxID=30044 RepID=A0AAD4K650_9MUSC|nr:hypothetical protein KR093_010486 [Drosophila rubida]
MENTKLRMYWISLKVLILLLGLARAIRYRFDAENDEIFTRCPNKPSNIRTITDIFDFSEFNIKDNGGKFILSGKLTSLWNYDPTDTLHGSIIAFRYERREWVSTVLSIFFNDMCVDLYNEQKYWYKFWTKFVVNLEDVKSKCLINGTTFIHEPFQLNFGSDVPIMVPEGRYKVVIVFKLFDKERNERNTSICTEIIGELTKAKR